MNKNIGRSIRDARQRAGLSQAELAEKIGVSQAAIGQWERGTYTPRGRNLNTLAAVLGVGFQPEFLLDDESENRQSQTAHQGVIFEDVTASRRQETPESPERQDELFNAEEARSRFIISEHKAQAGEFEHRLFQLLKEIDPATRALVPLEGGPMRNRWLIDILSDRAVIEVKHPASYNRVDDMITRTLWQLTVLRSFIGESRKYVAIIRRPPLAPFPSHAQPFYEKRITKLAAEADLVGIHLIIVDTPEGAAKAIAEIEDDREDDFPEIE
jgi:transcriptional regulator with XRE-family HTH domain